MSETVERITQTTVPQNNSRNIQGKNVGRIYTHGQEIGYNIDYEPTLKPSRDQKRRSRMRFVRTREIEIYHPRQRH